MIKIDKMEYYQKSMLGGEVNEFSNKVKHDKEVELLKLEIERLRGLLEISAEAHEAFGQSSLAIKIMKSLNRSVV